METLKEYSTSLIELLSKPLAVLLVALVLAEFIALMISIGRFRQPLKRARVAVTRRRWDLVSALFYLILLSVAFWELGNVSAVSLTWASGGATLFVLGWGVRYIHQLAVLVWRRLPKLRPLLAHLRLVGHPPASPIYLQRLGIWLEITGVSIVAKSTAVLVPSLALFPLVLWRAILAEEEHIHPDVRDQIRPSIRSVIPIIAWSVLTPATVVVAIGLATREVTLFHGDIESARTLLIGLTQVEGPLGVLAITITFVLAQLAGASLTMRAAPTILRRPVFWVALGILLASVTYNIMLTSRLSLMVPQTGVFDHWLIDVSLVGAALATMAILLFIWKASTLVSPEAVVRDALRQLDGGWLDSVIEDWREQVHYVTLRPGNPLVVVERVLASSIESGDSFSFAAGLVLLRDRLLELGRGKNGLAEHMIELDAHLHYHLRSLVWTMAKRSDSYCLVQMVEFVRELGPPSPIAVASTRSSLFEDPPGESLLRDILRQALEHKLRDPLKRGLIEVKQRAEIALKTLPEQEETFMYNPNRGEMPYPESSEEDRDKYIRNDLRVHSFEEQYLDYFEQMARQGIHSGMSEIGQSASLQVTLLMSQMQEHVSGSRLRRYLLDQALFALYDMSNAACASNLPRALMLNMLQYVAEKLDKESDADIALGIVHFAKAVLHDQAEAGIIDSSTIVSIAMCGLRIVATFTDLGIELVEGMAVAAQKLRAHQNFSEDRKLQSAYRELISRIRQQVFRATQDDRERVGAKVKSLLEQLGEPEFETGR